MTRRSSSWCISREAEVKLIDFRQLGPEKGINYSRDHLRRKCKADEFPKPLQLSDRRISWIEEEIDQWLADRAAARDGQGEVAVLYRGPNRADGRASSPIAADGREE